jgi:hypothetical protein
LQCPQFFRFCFPAFRQQFQYLLKLIVPRSHSGGLPYFLSYVNAYGVSHLFSKARISCRAAFRRCRKLSRSSWSSCRCRRGEKGFGLERARDWRGAVRPPRRRRGRSA